MAAVHLTGLLVALALIGPLDTLSWGSQAALVFFLGFVVLLEVCLVILAIGLAEALASTPARRRLLDCLKSFLLAAYVTLLAASLLKLALTGSHLARLDLWFIGSNLDQLAGESLGTEVALVLVLTLLCLAIAVLLYRAFQAARRRPISVPVGSFLLLILLAVVGAVYSATRYPDADAIGRSLAPEIGWLLGDAPATAAGTPARPVTGPLSGPPIEPYAPDPPADAPNVVLVMLESVPWNVMESDNALEATPNLRALADQSVTFTRAYAPSVHSDYAQMAILSSLHPRKFDHHDYYERIEYPRTLIWDTLAAAGWATGMFSCQNEGWGNMVNYLRTPGLQTFRHSPDWPTAPHRGRGSESKVFEATAVDAWQNWLEADSPSPWLAYLNFQSTHFPYETPVRAPHPYEPYEIDFPASFIRYPTDKVAVMRNRYLNALRYSDQYLGEIVRVLRERGEWDRTILVVVSDHGEAFYEHGQPTHGTQLFEEQVRSLALVRLPGEEPRLVEQPVSLLDLVPALVEHLGLPPHGNFQGRPDIFATDYSARGRPFLFTIQGLTNEDGVMLDDWKYTVNWRTGVRALYHVASDPFEIDNLAESEPQRAERLDQLLGELLGRQIAYYDQRGWQAGLYAERLP